MCARDDPGSLPGPFGAVDSALHSGVTPHIHLDARAGGILGLREQRARRLRGTWLDPFDHTEERKLERQLARDYEAIIAELLRDLSADRRPLAVAIAGVPERIRGYGHVKLANVATANARQSELLARWRGVEVRMLRRDDAGHDSATAS